MNKVFFTGDTHFGHRKIIKYCNRPFQYPTDNPNEPFLDVGEMNEMLIKYWNEVVEPSDTVYHVGDFAFDRHPEKYLSRLNGTKHLIKGNHDKQPSIKQGWASINDYREIRVEGQIIILFHYACRVWNKSHRGSWMLYGHSHGTLSDDINALSIDVGADNHNYRPISFNKVKRIMAKKTFKPIDHHERS